MRFLDGVFSSNWHFNIFYGLLFLAAATLPFTNYLMLPIAILMLLNWMVEWNWKGKWKIIRDEKRIPAFIIFSSICFIVIYGFFISYNKGHAMAYFDLYLWFFTAPMVMLAYPRELLSKRRIQNVLGIFATATTAHIITLFLVAFWKFITTGKTYYFTYESFSLFLHPTYISMFATLSFSFILVFLHQHKEIQRWKKVALLGALLCLFAGIICLSSKAAIIVFVILSVIWLLYIITDFKKRIICGVALLILFSGLVLVLQKSNSYTFERFKSTRTHLSQHKEYPNGNNSTQIRISTWKSSWEVAKKNLPWGVGTGDVNNELGLNAIHHNYKNLIGKQFNAHNQYLQNILSTGIAGITILLLFSLYPLILAIKRKDILLLTFAIIMIINNLVESTFEVRVGVDFFAAFNVLLYLNSEKDLDEKSSAN